MYGLQRNSDDHYFFHPKLGVIWSSYILDVPWQDNDWYTDALVVDGDKKMPPSNILPKK